MNNAIKTPERASALNRYYLQLAKTYRLKARAQLPWISLYNGHHAQQQYDELMARADYINQERLHYFVPYLRCAQMQRTSPVCPFSMTPYCEQTHEH